MSFSEWKKALRTALDDMPDDEVDSAIDYYKEMFADMSELGHSEEKILAEFGDPYDCADKIRRDFTECDAQTAKTEKKADIPPSVSNFTQKGENGSKEKTEKKQRVSVGEAIGTFFFSLLIVLPLAAVAFAVIAALGACAIAGGGIALGGALLCAASPALLFLSYGISELIMTIGAGLTMIGIGGLVAVGFTLATKYSAKGTTAFLKLIYRRF